LSKQHLTGPQRLTIMRFDVVKAANELRTVQEGRVPYLFHRSVTTLSTLVSLVF
jgi:hypothetical protein